MKTNFSVIVPAYKENKIYNTLNLLLQQKNNQFNLQRIFLIASGYEDKIVFNHPKVIVIEEKVRKGKIAAINMALKKIHSELIIVESGDTIPKKDTIEKLLRPFKDPTVGMTCGRPIPISSKKTFLGFLTHLIWFLHHLISLERAKGGEIIAFRKIFNKIPTKIAADEAYVESVFSKKDYKIVYVPTAIVNNFGIENLSYILDQRKRYFIGHLHIKQKYGYFVSSMSIKRIFKALFEYFKIKSIQNYKETFWIFCAIFLETYARILASIEFYIFKKVPYKWKIVRLG